MRDDVILAQALSGYAKTLRAQSTSRKYAGEAWAANRAMWRAIAKRATELATQAASMAEIFEEPRPRTFDIADEAGNHIATVRG